MTTTELRDKLLRTVWATQSAQTPTYVHKDVMIAVNRAYQELWTAPKAEFLRRRAGSITTASGTSSYDLGSTIVELIGPVTGTSGALIPCSNKADFNAFADRFLQADTSLASGEPVAYYYERLNASNTAADPITSNLHLTPTPASVYSVTFEAAYDPPQFDDCQLDSDGNNLPIPHGWLEGILLPIAQFYMLDSHWYTKDQRHDATEAIMNGYAQARLRLGLSDPQIKTVKAAAKEAANY